MPAYDVDVVLPISVDHPYSYSISTDRTDSLIGCRVIAPLQSRRMAGLVIDQRLSASPDLKEIDQVYDDQPFVTSEILDLIRFLSDYYITPIGVVLKSALPGGSFPKVSRLIHLRQKDIDWNSLTRVIGKSKRKYEILKILKDVQSIRQTELEEQIGATLQRQLSELQVAGVIHDEFTLHEPSARPKTVMAIQTWQYSSERRHTDKQTVFLNWLESQTLPVSIIHAMKTTGISRSVINGLEKRGELTIAEQVEVRYSKDELTSSSYVIPAQMTDDQRRVFDAITQESSHYGTHLIHGVTGSGKTLIYMNLIQDVLERGQSVIMMIPEIALTPQTVQRFKSMFGETVTVIHSRLSAGEKYDAWQRMRDGHCRLLIGPRSTVFTPVPKLGMMIIDEEHDGSYKQSEQAPPYHARDAAVIRARQADCPLVLGSATPSYEAMANALSGKFSYHILKKRATDAALPTVEIIDMKHELKRFPSADQAVLSEALETEIERRLMRQEQIILFQNRRGHSSYVQCTHCGHIQNCDNCSIPMVYHKVDRQLKCHFCDATAKLTPRCTHCGSESLKPFGSGTQRLEEMLTQRFPDARLLRMDQDSTRQKNAHQRILAQFEHNEADILLGTQMISKGLDFENVTLVGIINADLSLSLPDFRSVERSFQLFSQVAGRAGRNQKAGHVIIQTFQPDHPVFAHVVDHDFTGLFHDELDARTALGYPPFQRLINCRFSHEDAGTVEDIAQLFTTRLRQWRPSDVDILGPTPCTIERIRKRYRWHTLIKLKNPAVTRDLKVVLNRLRSDFSSRGQIWLDTDPLDLL